MTQWLEDLWFRLRAVWRRDQVRQEMNAEFRFHIEQATRRNVERGMSPDAARTAALRAFGGVSFYEEAGADEYEPRWLHDIAGDVRYGLRTLRNDPRFTVATVLTIAIAIAANTAVFSVLNGVLLRPLPFASPERLVYLGWDYGSGRAVTSLSLLQLTFARDHATMLDGVATYSGFERPFGGPDAFDVARGITVSRDFIRVTRATPRLGRGFDSTETAPGGADVAMLSEAFWRTRFGARDDVIGKTVRLDDRTYVVVGVMPPEFRLPGEAPIDVLLPMQLAVDPGDAGQNYFALARLKDGVSHADLDVDLQAVSRAIITAYPQIARAGRKAGPVNTDAHFARLEFADVFIGTMQRTLWILLAAVALIALIACVNVANLLLVRAAARRREIAVRATLGAGRGRIVRQLLIESLLISIIGGALGLAIGLTGIRVLLAFAPTTLPRLNEVGFDLRVALFTAGISIITGLLVGTISALSGTRLDLLGTLGRGNSRGSTGAGRSLRELLVGAETAIAVVLLSGAGLLITSFARLRAVDPGFDISNVHTIRFGRLPSAYRPQGAQWELEKRLLQDLRATSGLQDVVATAKLPLQRGQNNIPVAPSGRDDIYDSAAEWRAVSDRYFSTFRIPLRGRDFSAADEAASPRVAIVSAAMAQRYWPGENPIGKRLDIGRWQGRWLAPGLGPAEVIGVAGDVREMDLASPPRLTFYVPRSQWPEMLRAPQFAIRASGATHVGLIIENAVRRIDPRIKQPVVEPMSAIVGEHMSSRRFETMLLALFAAAALLLTAIGIYGVVASAVAARRREIGIRMALGARATRVVSSIVGRGMAVILAGAFAGCVVALASTRVLAAKLFAVTPTDPRTMVLALLTLGVAALLAAWIPARRAALVPPSEALRGE